MIRRLFWLTLGAVLGISAYRRATAVARAIMPGPRAREITSFAGDVREGMQMYRQRQLQASRPALEGRPGRTEPDHTVPDHTVPDHTEPDHTVPDNTGPDQAEDGR
jgi:hypothetical protein